MTFPAQRSKRRMPAALWTATGIAAGIVAFVGGVSLQASPAAEREAVFAPVQACQQSGWHRASGAPSGVSYVGLDTAPSIDHIYAAILAPAGGALFRGKLSDASPWSLRAQNMPVTNLAVGPNGGPLLLSLMGDGLVRSLDGGDSFGPVELSGRWITAVAASESGLLAGDTGPDGVAIHAQQPSGTEWLPMAGGEDIPTRVFRTLRVDSRNRSWAGTAGFGVYRYGSDSEPEPRWQSMSDASLAVASVFGIAFDSGNPDRIYVGLGQDGSVESSNQPMGLRVSADDGLTWSRAALDDVSVTAIVAARTPRTAFAATWGRGLAFSTNGGDIWQSLLLPSDAGSYFSALTSAVPQGFDASSCELLIAGGQQGIWLRNIAGEAHDYSRILLPNIMRDHTAFLD